MKRFLSVLPLLLSVVLLTGCGESAQQSSDDDYPVLTIQKQDYTIQREFTVLIESANPIALRPQVGGMLKKILVREGAVVKKDQPLFIIDQVPYQAAVRSAEAAVATAKATLATARLALEGKEELFRKHVVGDFDLKKVRNEAAEAESNLANAEAELLRVRNELSYTVVKSPIDGKIAMIEYREGELVDPSMEKEMTTISDNTRIYAYMGFSEKMLYDLAHYYKCTYDELPGKLPPVTLRTYWGQELEQKGRIDAISNVVEPDNGAIIVRATFDNPDQLFRSGSNATLVIPYEIAQTIVVPQEATYDIQDKVFVYKVVDGVTQACEIEVMPYNDGRNYVVRGGLKVGDVIIADGAGLLKNGVKVKTRPAAAK